MSVPEFLDSEKTYEFVLADDESGSGSAVVKMAPVEKRDATGERLMSGAFDAQKGHVFGVLPGHRTDKPTLGKIAYDGEKAGKFVGSMNFNPTPEAQNWRMAAKTDPVQASIRFRAKMSDVDRVEIGNGRYGYDIRKAVIREVSLTGLGMMPGTGLSRVKADGPAADEPAPAIPFPRSLAASDLSHRSL